MNIFFDPMEEIVRRLESIEQRLAALEQRPKPSYAEDLAMPAAGVAQGQNLAHTQTPAPSAARATPERKDMESFIGRWWLGIAGVIAVLFGASFFLKYAFEQNLIGPIGRVMIEILAGLLFIVVGEWLRKRYPRYSFIVTGGGLGLLYLATFGAFQWYSLISQTTAFGFMVAVTAFGIVLSLYADAIELAGIAMFGGFLTPFLLAAGQPQGYNFFGYLTVLNLGILSVAFFKKWRRLSLLGFVCTVASFLAWYAAYYRPEKLFFTLGVLGVFYVIYLAIGVLGPWSSQQPTDAGDLFVLTINPAWFFGWYYMLLKPDYEYSLGFLAALFGALYVLLAYIGLQVRRNDIRMITFLSSIAVIFLTIAVPLQLHQHAITIAWAVEAAVLVWVGLNMQLRGLRMAGLCILVLSLIHLFFFDSGVGDITEFVPLFNKRFFTYLAVTAAAGVIAYGTNKFRDLLNTDDRKGGTVAGLLMCFLILVSGTLEISSTFAYQIYTANAVVREQQRESGRPSDNYYYDSYRANADTHYRSLANQRNAAISVFWTIYAIILITVGMSYHKAALRWAALALFGVTAGKVFLIDLASLRTPYRIISFMVLGILLLVSSYLYFRFEKKMAGAEPTSLL
ncbi:MAG: DUF2339 domain-containing protein [Candidatus Sungbacteria bacterium]|nr:DUF2339 domain-containing protein [Candidatus Sungbacteria bacterium]